MTAFPWTNEGRTPARATPADFERAARQLGVGVPEIKAVWKVEAAGRPFRSDGSVERRFEPHHFPRRHWEQLGFDVRDGEPAWRASVRQSNEVMLQQAYALNPSDMLRSTSWGAPQIMGFNYADAGFLSAEHMVRDMAVGEAKHLEAFTNLVIKWGLGPAIRAHDWETFARRYNGPGQVHHYAGLLRSAFGVTSVRAHAAALERATREETGQASFVVLKRGSEGPTVRRLQEILGIKVDGVFGTDTENAVREFQHHAGIVVDGLVGARTWQALVDRGASTRGIAEQPTTAVAPESPLALVGAVAAVSGFSAQPWIGIAVIAAVAIAAAFIYWKRNS